MKRLGVTHLGDRVILRNLCKNMQRKLLKLDVYHNASFNPLNAKIVAANFLVARSLFSSKRSVGSVRELKRLAKL